MLQHCVDNSLNIALMKFLKSANPLLQLLSFLEAGLKSSF